MSLGRALAEVIVTVTSPLWVATSSLKPSMTPSVSPNLPFSDSTEKRFLVISVTPSFFAPVPSARATRVGIPAVRSFDDKVGFVTKALSSGVDFIEDEIALSSACTLLSVWGDFARAAEKTALEYLRAMELAARRPRPAEEIAERAEDRSIVGNQTRVEDKVNVRCCLLQLATSWRERDRADALPLFPPLSDAAVPSGAA